MKIRPLIIDDGIRAKIGEMLAYGAEHFMTFDEIKQITPDNPVGDDFKRTLVIPLGYKVTYSVEEQPPPIGWSKHISISVIDSSPQACPSIASVEMIMKEFKLDKPLSECHCYMEDIDMGHRAINIIFPIKSTDELKKDIEDHRAQKAPTS